MSFYFAGPATGTLAYSGSYDSSIYFNSGTNGGGFLNFSGVVAGTVSIGPIDPMLASDLDFNGGYFDGMGQAVIPTFVDLSAVPEPASLALFAVGALGAFGAARLRKAG